MIILTPYVVAGLVGKMYVLLSQQESDKSLSYMDGYLDVIQHYESALKYMLIFQSDLKETPVRRKLFSLKLKKYDNQYRPKKESDYLQGQIDANNNLYYHVQNCYKGK